VPYDDTTHVLGEQLIPWERPAPSFVTRALTTMASAFAPMESAASILSTSSVGPALSFAALFALPMMALWAVMPFTHTLAFKPGAVLEVTGGADDAAIALDVLRAAGIGIGMGVVGIASWAVPFGSLLRAYAPHPEQAVHAPAYAARLALYRCFLAPLAMGILYLVSWLVPGLPVGIFGVLSIVLSIMPRLILLMHTVALARACHLEGLPRLIVVLVPLAVEAAVGLVVSEGLTALLPPTPSP
jgi:hypothetical protein